MKEPRLIPTSWAARAGLIGVVWMAVITTVTIVNGDWVESPVKNRPIEAPVEDYVSSNTCRSCHPGNYASWHASFHRTMTQVVSADTTALDLDGLEKTYDGVDYRVERKEKEYYVRSKPAGAPASAYAKPRKIVLSTGSHTLQVYWLETGHGRSLDQFPFGYLVLEKKWAPIEHTFLTPPGPKQVYDRGDWNNGCINCHTTHGRARPSGNGVFDSQVGEFGISCEACHGEGREHIEKNRNPLRRFALHWSDGADSTIANPARMNGAAASLACGQCHSIWAFDNPSDTRVWDRDGGKFRPGMTELDQRWVVQPTSADHPIERDRLLKENPHFFGDSFWGDGMVRVTGRELNGTMASPCYKGGHFSCLSCHEMHPQKTDARTLASWRDDQIKSGMESDQACLQCHQDMRARLTTHTRHRADSSGSRCYNCHMPHTTYGLLRAVRSHQISSPTARESVEQGRPNACNLCHLDQPLAWTADKLTEWYGQPSPKLSPDDRQLSAAAQWILKGDAGQRMLVAWSMGWEPAQKASGRDWLYPFLIFELNDPYAALRFGAWKSLQTLPGFFDYEFDYSVDDAAQKLAVTQAYKKWFSTIRKPNSDFRPQTLLDSAGNFRQEIFERMLDERNNRKILLVE